MRKLRFPVLALMGTAALILGIPVHSHAAGPILPIIGKLPIPAPPSLPGVPSLPGGPPGVPSLPSLPGVGAPPAGLPGLPQGVSPTDVVTQNVAYLEKPGSLSPTKAGALLDTVSGTVLPQVPGALENPSVLLLLAELGGLMEIQTLPPADQTLLLEVVGFTAPGTPESIALTTAAEEIASEVASSPLGPSEKSVVTPALRTVVHDAQPVLNQTAAQLDRLPSLPSLPTGTSPSASSAPSLPSTSSLTKMASLPKSSSAPSTSTVTKEINKNVPGSSAVTKDVKNPPSSSTLTKETGTVTRMTKTSSLTKQLPKT